MKCNAFLSGVVTVCCLREQDICVYTNAFAILGLVLFGRPVFWMLSTAYLCLLGMPALVPVKVRNRFHHPWPYATLSSAPK